jgi:mannose/fructose/N-acetylgalactosamine-specific phosphotransferase system component IIC
MGSQKAATLAAIGAAINAANAAGDSAQAGALATAFYWVTGAESPYQP